MLNKSGSGSSRVKPAEPAVLTCLKVSAVFDCLELGDGEPNQQWDIVKCLERVPVNACICCEKRREAHQKNTQSKTIATGRLLACRDVNTRRIQRMIPDFKIVSGWCVIRVSSHIFMA